MRRVGKTTNAAGQEVTLHEAIYDYDNLLKSYNKARRGKRYRKEVLRYTRKKEENIQRTQDELRELTYNPSGYRYFKVYEPKERQIMALPFYDRVVQHAINNILDPIFEKRFTRIAMLAGKRKARTPPATSCKSGYMTGRSTTKARNCTL